jgi:hypothetical protein
MLMGYTSLMSQCVCVQGSVTLYDGDNYTGASKNFVVGAYTDLAQAGFASDTMSSIKVQSGCTAILFANSNYGGETRRITSGTNQAGLGTFNNQASSLIVTCTFAV